MKTIAQACLFALSAAAAAAANAQMSYADGARLMAKYNCQSCHAMNQTLAGPSLIAIAQRYSSDLHAPAYLEAHVLNGSIGVWGSVPHGAGQCARRGPGGIDRLDFAAGAISRRKISLFTRQISFRQRTFARRSAMRVCQPGPVAFHRAITSAGNRRDINLRGFVDTGLPPFLIFARFSICSVNSGSSSYSTAFTT